MPGTVHVSSLTQLHSALAKAQGGETILLAGGDYGEFALTPQSKFDFTFPSNVTIASADPANPAVFSDVDVRKAANLTFDGIIFDYTFSAGEQIYKKPFLFSECQNITIRNSTFDGDVAKGVSAEADGLGTGIGLVMRQCSGSTVENNEFFSFYRGLTMGSGFDATIRSNELHSLRMDGMNFSQMQGIVIEGNYIHDFIRSSLATDHADMIQFWTNNTSAPSTDIVIRNNVLDVGGGDSTQSIFMRNDQVDRGLAGEELYYQNVLIENNVIYNGHANGVIVGETKGLVIRNNSVLHADGGNADGLDAQVEIPRISVASSSIGVTVTGNVVSSIGGWSGQAGWTVSSNAFVQDQDPHAPGYYADVFIDSTLSSADGTHDFVILPGGMIARLGAGASTNQYNPVSDGPVDVQFTVSEDPADAATRIFDARLTAFETGARPEGTAFIWSFGDGTIGRGPLISHAFDTRGIYDVTLKVVLPDGTVDTETYQVGIAGSHVVSMDQAGQFLVYEDGVEVVLGAAAAAGAGLQLGAAGVTASVDNEYLAPMLGTDSFRIGLTLQADVAKSYGEVFRMKDFFITSINAKGELELRIFPEGSKEVKVTTNGASLNDQAQHDIDVRFEDGKLEIYVDQTLNASANMAGQMRTDSGNLVFGNPTGAVNFKGDLTAFEITVNEGSYQQAGQQSLAANDPLALTSESIFALLSPEPDSTNIFSIEAATTSHVASASDRGHALSANFVPKSEGMSEQITVAEQNGAHQDTATPETRSPAQASTHAGSFFSAFFGTSGPQPGGQSSQDDHYGFILGDRFEFFSSSVVGHDMMPI